MTKFSKFVSLGGIAGPVIFTVVVLVAAYLRPEYSHFNQLMSELGESGGFKAWVMNYFGFMPTGFLIALSAIGLAGFLAPGKLAYIGATLIFIFGVGVFIGGIVSCDQTCMPVNPSLEQNLHNLVSAIAFSSIIAANFIIGIHFIINKKQMTFGVCSIAASFACSALIYAMIESAEPRQGAGLYQRILIGMLFAWLSILSIKSWRA